MKNIVNVYEAVDANKTKSSLVVLFFVIFVVGVAWVFAQALDYGLWIVGFALILAGLGSLGGYWFSDRIILTLSRARPADKKRDFHFFTVAENLAMAAGLPKPRLYVIEDPAPNAFATGRDPEHAVVCVTRGLLEKLDRTELEGVVAHELSHIGNYDIRLMGIVAILAGTVIILADILIRAAWFGGSSRRKGSALVLALAFLLALLSPIIANLIKLAVSRRREFLADASAAKLTRFPEGLVRALEKIASDPHQLKAVSNATAHLFIENPFKVDSRKKEEGRRGWFAGLFNTHPPVEERIRVLRTMV